MTELCWPQGGDPLEPPLPAMPFEQAHPLQPAPVLRALLERGPVHRVRTRVGDEAWLVTGYAQIRSLYSGDLLGRSHPKPECAARLTASALFGGRPQENYASEDSDRAWFREVLYTIMSPAKLRELRPWVDTLVTSLLDEFAAAARPADLIDLVAVPLPTLVICKLLGLPTGYMARCRELAEAIACPDDEGRSKAGLTEMTDLLRQVATSGEAESDGLIARLRSSPYRLRAPIVAYICSSLMFTGHHTTVVAIGYAALLLLLNPDQGKLVRADLSRLPDLIEESLRTGNVGVNTGGGNGIPTYARTDIEIGNVRIEAGDLVLLDTGAGNHDEQIFGDAYQFDIDRPANPHLTFGYGRHYCPGAGLARLELLALLTQLVPRFPTMRLAVELADLRAHDDQITGGLVALPVTW
ncbi:MAG TPA: cytochrome P450 [Streptosporangiaceae bacterium]